MSIPAFRRAAALAALFLLFTTGPSQAALPPEAQAAVDKGVLAAKEQEWDIAIQSFQEARKTAPNAPEVFYNLGLAESKIPGRELRAIAWFGAYLAAAPHASNVATVKSFIAGLQVKNEGNLNRLAQSLQVQATQLPQDRDVALGGVASLWIEAGDVTAAFKNLDIAQTPDEKSRVLRGIAIAQATTGSSSETERTINLIDDTSMKNETELEVAEAQARAGNIASAQRTVDLIPDTYPNKTFALEALSSAQESAGDFAGAIVNARRDIEVAENNDAKLRRMNLLMYLQLKTNDMSGAKETLATFIGIADSSHIENNDFIYQDLTNDQLDAGNVAEAVKSANLITDLSVRNTEVSSIQNYIRDHSVALASRPVQLTAPVITAADWIKKLDNDYKDQDCALNTSPFLDLAAYLKSLPETNTYPGQVWFTSYTGTAQKLFSAKNVIDKMLKQQAKQQGAP